MKAEPPMRTKSDLLRLQAFPTELYANYALTSLTAYCVFWLRQWGITTSLENIAVASHRMFPVKFGMVGWPQFSDLTRTSRSVLQMRPKWRNLATSTSAKGVFLNQRGIQEAERVGTRLGPPRLEGEAVVENSTPLPRAERGARVRTVHDEDLVKEARDSQLFELYRDSRVDEWQAIHLVGMLGVYDHTPSKAKRDKLRKLVDAAKELRDTEMMKFLGLVEERFRRYLNR